MEITHSDRRRWQLRAARYLVDLLTLADQTDLPVLAWDVSTTTVIVGKVLVAENDGPARRAAWQAWADFLASHPNYKVSPERTDHAGITHLHFAAEATDPHTLSAVQIVIQADLFPQEG